MNQNITRIGVDIAKNVFQLCAVNHQGTIIFNKTLKRNQITPFFANLARCEVILESRATSNYWARVFTERGHVVKLISRP